MKTITEKRTLQLLQLFIAQVQTTGICNYPELSQTIYRAWQQERQTRLLQLYIQEVKQTGKSEIFGIERPKYPCSD